MSVEAVGTARRGRGARRAIRRKHVADMLPALQCRLPLTEPMDAAQVERCVVSACTLTGAWCGS